MFPTRLGLAAATFCLTASLAGAATVGGYTSLFVFGDSLSDAGNLSMATGGAFPGAAYFNGRFSNGPVWADEVAAEFSSTGLATANFAFGFANAVTNGDGVPDMEKQIGMFGATVPQTAYGTNSLAALWFGANDIFGAVDSMMEPDNVAVAAVGVAAAKAVAGGIAALAGAGIGNFLVFNVPDLGTLPAYALFKPSKTAAATAGTLAFNAELNTNIAELRAIGLNITLIDAYGLYRDVLDNPSAFGITDTENPCYIPGEPICSEDEAATRAFFDWVHPNAVLHRALAGIVEDTIAPAAVPLPASAPLLGLALAGLGAVRPRRRAA